MRRNGGVVRVAPAIVEKLHEQRGRMLDAARREGEERLVARWRAARPSRMRSVVALTAAGALAATGVAVFEHRAARSLGYSLKGGHVDRDGVIELDPGAQAMIRFSDGSDVSLAPGTHASLRDVDGHGAFVSVGGGSAYVDVTPRPEARWSFEAGPFLIDVTGTAFRFAWDPDGQELDLRMDRGSVRVSGPLSGGALALHSGQRLIVRVRQGETVIREREWSAPAEASAVAAAPPPRSPETSTPTAPPSAGGAKPQEGFPEVSWQALVTGGHFEAVMRDVRRRGVDECIAGASSAELAALADAARYSRHDDIARRALVAERRRFPGSPSARDAAFLLGRLEETGQDAVRAIEWYEAYLRETPDGTYASDALGREMLLLQQTSMGARARAAADQYLSRFPAGPYAARARAIAQTP